MKRIQLILKFYAAFLFVSCSSPQYQADLNNITQESISIETIVKFCPGGRGGDSVKIVLDSSVKNLPTIDYQPPLSKTLITGGFECRFGTFHGAIDLVDLRGTPVTAIADGIVKFSGHRRLTGNTVILFHPGNGTESLYGHGDQNLVKVGDKIQRGQSIQTLGNTGQSTGPHLHLQISYQSALINPCTLINCKN